MKTHPRTTAAAAASHKRAAIILGAVLLFSASAPRSGLAANGPDDWVTGAGDGSGNWNSSVNWFGTNEPPINGDSLIFGTTTGVTLLNNNITSGSFTGLTFSAAAPSYTLQGNGIALTGSITNSSANLQSINFNIAGSGTSIVMTTAGGGNTIFGGNISGAYGLTLEGSGLATLSSANNTYTGQTALISGSLAIGASSTGPSGAPTSGPIGTGTLYLDTTNTGATLEALNGAQAIANNLSTIGTKNGDVINIAGSNNLTFTGTLENGQTGVTFVDNNSGTTSLAAVVGGQTVAFTGGGTMVVLSTTNSSTGLAYSGSGEMILSGTSYSGQVIVNSGTMALTGTDAGSATGTGPILVNGGVMLVSGDDAVVTDVNGGTLQFGASNTTSATLTSIFTGSLAGGTGTISLNGYNESILNLTFGSNNSNFQNQASATTGSGTLTVTGNITYSGSQQAASIGGNLAIAATSGSNVIAVSHSVVNGLNGTDLTIGANITGNSIFSESNSGFTVLSGSNSYTGTTWVQSNAVLILANSYAVTSSAGIETAGNGTLQLEGGISLSSTVPLFLQSSGQTPQANTSGQYGALVNLTGNNTVSGTINLLGSTTISANSGTLNLSGPITGSKTLLVQGAGYGTLSGVVGIGSDTFTKAQSGTWTFNGSVVSTFTSGLLVDGGVLEEDFTNLAAVSGTSINLLSTTNPLTLNGGVLYINGNPGASTATGQTFASTSEGGNLADAIILNPNGGTGITMGLGTIGHGSAGASLLINETAAGSDIIKVGNSNGILGWVLVQTSGSTGMASVASGTLTQYNDQAGAALAAGSNSSTTNFTTYAGGGNLTMTGGNWSANTLAVDTTNGGGTLNLTSGTLTLTDQAIVYRGPNNETIANGQIGAGSQELIVHALGSGTLTIGSLIGPSSDTFPLTIDGGGVVSLTGNNVYTGPTLINSGVLQLASGTSSSGTLMINSGQLEMETSTQIIGASGVVLVANAPDVSGTFNLNGFNQTVKNLNLFGANSDNASQALVETSSGTLTISGTVFYDQGGATNIPFTDAPKGATITGNLALLNPSGTTSITVVHSPNSGSADLTISAVISGSAVTVAGTGVVVFSGANTYTGTTNIGSNTVLNIQNSLAFQDTAYVSGTSNSTLQLQGGVSIGAVPLSINGSGDTGTGQIYQDGALVNVSGSNSYAGNITLVSNSPTTIAVDSGTLALSGSISSTNLNLNLTGTGVGIASGNIVLGTGALIKNGPGMWILTGTNPYTGATTVNSGTLVFNGNNTGSSNSITVNGGATIAGTGTIGGAVSVAGGGAGAPYTQGSINLFVGTTTTGTLTIANGKNLTLGSTIGGEPANLVFGVGSNSVDTIAISGALMLQSGGAVITIDQLPSTSIATGIYNLLTYTTSTGGTNGNNNLAGNFTLATSSVSGQLLRLFNTGTAEELGVGETNTTYNLALSNGRIMSGGTATLTATVTNSGTLLADALNYYGLTGTLSSGAGTVGGSSPNGGPLAQGVSGSNTNVTFTSTNVGANIINPTASGSNATLGTTASLGTVSSGTVDVVQNRTISASSVTLDTLVGGTNSAQFVLSSPGSNATNTTLAIASGTTVSGGISAGFGAGQVFNGSNTTGTLNVSGNFATSGQYTGSINVATTGEGLSGEVDAPVNVGYTANVYQAFSGSTSSVSNSGASSTLYLSNLASTDGGQRAGVTMTGWSVSNTSYANGNFVVTADNSGQVGTANGSDVTQDVGTVAISSNALSGSYAGYSGIITGTAVYTDTQLQGTPVANQQWTGITVSGGVVSNTSPMDTVNNAYINSGSSLAGYGLTSSFINTVATMLNGTTSANTNLTMEFTFYGSLGGNEIANPSIYQSSETLTLGGLHPIGGSGFDGSTLTDTFVLQLSVEAGGNPNVLGGQYYLGWWDPNFGGTGGWVNAIAGNSNGSALDYFLTPGYFEGSYATYLTTPVADGGGMGLSLSGQLGAYGYDATNGNVWAVLNYDSDLEVIPEPGTYALVLSGFGLLAGFHRVRRRGLRKR